MKPNGLPTGTVEAREGWSLDKSTLGATSWWLMDDS